LISSTFAVLRFLTLAQAGPIFYDRYYLKQ